MRAPASTPIMFSELGTCPNVLPSSITACPWTPRILKLCMIVTQLSSRDAVTTRDVADVRAGTGEWGRREPASLMEGLTPGTPPADADDDGMPDEWEAAHGLDAGKDDSAKVMASGYTAIEEYVNETARRLVAQRLVAQRLVAEAG